ncbi:hypothetical protein SAMN02799622_04265 [Methylobacterium sp. UNC378MF]|nr:hypothetical protein SAMN02799622_04265 [Methylobacterium sp. UNC378MF]
MSKVYPDIAPCRTADLHAELDVLKLLMAVCKTNNDVVNAVGRFYTHINDSFTGDPHIKV